MHIPAQSRAFRVTYGYDAGDYAGRIASLRSIACFLLVLYHVIGASPVDGLTIEDGLLRDANDTLAVIRMPLFALLAGWTYSLRPVLAGGISSFIIGKVRRLVVPMLVVGAVYIAVQDQVMTANHRFTDIPFLTPVAHFWFLQALFLVFIAVGLIENAGRMRTFNQFALIMSMACILLAFGPFTHLFAIGGAVYLLPFFLVGIALDRFRIIPYLDRPEVRLLLAVELLVGLLALGGPQIDRFSIAALAVGILGCLLLAGMNFNSPLLESWSKYTFAIFLFHVFFTAGSRILLTGVGVENIGILVGIGLAAGLIGPALLQAAIERSAIAGLLLLGRPLPASFESQDRAIGQKARRSR